MCIRDRDIVIDLKSKTVMPGLIDLHVHIESEFNPQKYMNAFTANDADIAFGSLKFAEITLMAGFTTVRDLGGTGINISLRDAIAKNKTPSQLEEAQKLARDCILKEYMGC